MAVDGDMSGLANSHGCVSDSATRRPAFNAKQLHIADYGLTVFFVDCVAGPVKFIGRFIPASTEQSNGTRRKYQYIGPSGLCL